MEMNTIMRFLSATKLVTAIAVMQCVERGLTGLDDDVGQLVKELGDLKVLVGYNDQGKPELVDPKEKITLR